MQQQLNNLLAKARVRDRETKGGASDNGSLLTTNLVTSWPVFALLVLTRHQPLWVLAGAAVASGVTGASLEAAATTSSSVDASMLPGGSDVGVVEAARELTRSSRPMSIKQHSNNDNNDVQTMLSQTVTHKGA